MVTPNKNPSKKTKLSKVDKILPEVISEFKEAKYQFCTLNTMDEFQEFVSHCQKLMTT